MLKELSANADFFMTCNPAQRFVDWLYQQGPGPPPLGLGVADWRYSVQDEIKDESLLQTTIASPETT
jgi:hypothetical protein